MKFGGIRTQGQEKKEMSVREGKTGRGGRDGGVEGCLSEKNLKGEILLLEEELYYI